MNRRTGAVLLWCVSIAVAGPRNRPAELLRELIGLTADPNRTAAVVDLTIRRDAARYHLTAGTLTLLSPVDGRTIGMVFTGTGDLSYDAPNSIEHDHLVRMTGNDSIREPFRSLFLLFTDSTLAEVERSVRWTPAASVADAQEVVKRSLDYILHNDRTEADHDLFRHCVNASRGMFYGHSYHGSTLSYFFKADPYEDEEYEFSQYTLGTNAWIISGNREIVNKYTRSPQPRDVMRTMTISQVRLDNVLSERYHLDAKAELSFSFAGDPRSWIPLSLHPTLGVDSVLIDGAPAAFHRVRKSGMLWVGQDSLLSRDATHTLIIRYSGGPFDTDGYWKYLIPTIDWYPFPVEQISAPFQMTFTYPVSLTLVASGDRRSEQGLGNGMVRSEWTVTTPVPYVGFSMGRYDEHQLNIGTTTIRTYTTTAIKHGTALSGKSAIEEAMFDIENSYKFFSNLFGPLRYSTLYAVETPYSHGIAFPGYFSLSGITFTNALEKREWFDSFFRAHEVSHLWWGFELTGRSYHDRWLSEGFASYCGLWYTQGVRGNNESFFDALKDFRTAILGSRKFLLADGQKAGPIWLGYRTVSSLTSEDYNLIIYKKSAWVLHMLRMMALDLKTMNEDAFKGMMKDFFQSYRNGSATTADFQRMAEKHYRMDLTWFFRQWVYGTAVPAYSIHYASERVENGRYKIHCTVKQTNVPADFQMYIPFRIDFGEGRIVRFRTLIKGPVSEFDLPLLPMRPKEIVFNDLQSVLCEVQEEEWD